MKCPPFFCRFGPFGPLARNVFLHLQTAMSCFFYHEIVCGAQGRPNRRNFLTNKCIQQNSTASREFHSPEMVILGVKRTESRSQQRPKPSQVAHWFRSGHIFKFCCQEIRLKMRLRPSNTDCFVFLVHSRPRDFMQVSRSP